MQTEDRRGQAAAHVLADRSAEGRGEGRPSSGNKKESRCPAGSLTQSTASGNPPGEPGGRAEQRALASGKAAEIKFHSCFSLSSLASRRGN